MPEGSELDLSIEVIPVSAQPELSKEKKKKLCSGQEYITHDVSRSEACLALTGGQNVFAHYTL